MKALAPCGKELHRRYLLCLEESLSTCSANLFCFDMLALDILQSIIVLIVKIVAFTQSLFMQEGIPHCHDRYDGDHVWQTTVLLTGN